MVHSSNGQNLDGLNMGNIRHESMINQVSALVSSRNAKKLARQGASMSMSSGQEKLNSQSTNQAHTTGQTPSDDTDPTVRAGTMGSSFAAANEIDGAGLKQVRGPTETFSGSYLQQTHSVNTEGTANSQAQYTDVDSQSPVNQKAIKRILRSEGFYLNAEIEGVNILFIIDTGATRTVISDRVYNSIPEVRRPELKKCTVLTDVSGQPLSQQGSAFFTIKLASGVRLNSEIMVADIEDDGLFGHDLLSKGGAEILYSEGAIRFMGTSIPCKQINRDNLIRKVRAVSDFTIPDHSEMIVDAFLDRSEDDDLKQCDIILEPCSEFQERYGLLMAYSLSDLDSKVTHKVRMLNPCPHAISDNQDAILGTAEVVVQAVTLVTPNDRYAHRW